MQVAMCKLALGADFQAAVSERDEARDGNRLFGKSAFHRPVIGLK